MNAGSPHLSVASFVNQAGMQARRALRIDGPLPGEVLIESQAVTLTGFLETQQALAHSGQDYLLVGKQPASVRSRRKIGQRDALAVRPDEIRNSRPVIPIRHEHPPSVGVM
jgi:hypothetical protein